MTVLISPNIKRTRERIDVNGNVIDPRTKQVIEPKEVPYVPTAEELTGAAQHSVEPPVSSKSIKDQIIEAEKHLVYLKDLRKQEIIHLKKELEELEAE